MDIIESTISEYGLAALGAFATLLISSIKLINKWIDIYAERIKYKDELKRKELLVQTEANIKKIESENVPLVTDAIKLSKVLEEVREKFNAARVSLSIFHNGTQSGFKNFSVRYQETRTSNLSNINNMQVMPLTPYYKLIKDAESDHIFIFTADDDYPRFIVDRLKSENLSMMLGLVIMIDEEHCRPNHKLLHLSFEGKSYYPVGFFSIELDDESVFYKEDDLAYMRTLDTNLVNFYIRNPYLFG